MRRTHAVLIGLAVATSLLPATAHAATPSASALERVDRTIRDGMNASAVPGLAIAVVADGRIVHARGFGEADGSGRGVTPETPFVLGSTSKSFTALAVMQLVDAGRVDLDASIRRYLPQLKLATTDAPDRITVRQLLQQTSGLGETAGGPVLKVAAEGTFEDVLSELRDERLVSWPGDTFHYSNANYVLAGLIVERASGESYADYIQRHIFKPLGMRHSYTDLDEARAAGLAIGHRYWFGLRTEHGPTFRRGTQPAGFLISSAADMARYLSMYLKDGYANGRQIVSRQGVRTLFTPGRAAHLGPWSDGAEARYAMGWYVGGPWEELTYLHAGRAPDSGSMVFVLPRRGWAVVTLVNAAHALALPGYSAPIDRVERNAVDVLLGQRPSTAPSLRTFYLVFDLIAAALLGFTVWALVRAIRALGAGTPPRHSRLAGLRVAAGALLGIALLAIPQATEGWAASFTWRPDFSLLVLALVTLLLANAAVRLAWLIRTRRGRLAIAGHPHRHEAVL